MFARSLMTRVVAPGASTSSVASPLGALRTYADKPSGEFSSPDAAGAGAKAGFARREKAQEDSYFAKQEAEKLKKLRDSIKAQREHLDQLEKGLDELHKK